MEIKGSQIAPTIFLCMLSNNYAGLLVNLPSTKLFEIIYPSIT